MAKPSISIIISAKNEAAHVEACLTSLLNQEASKPFEILFVDNNSTDDTWKLAQKFARRDLRIHILKEKKPGSPCARNRGAMEANGEVLVFTDADCTFAPDWLEKITTPLLKTKKHRLPIGAVGGQTLSALPNGRKMNQWERYADSLWHGWEQDRVAAFPGFLPWAPTCNFAVYADIFHELGCFDENWKTAGYDSDFCWRLVMNGFVIGYEPKAVLYHKRRPALRALLKQIEGYGYHNRALLRHYERLLRYSTMITRKERIESLFRRTKIAIKQTKSLEEARHRALDIVTTIASSKGAFRSTYKRIKAEKRLDPSRVGKSEVAKMVPAPFSQLQRAGWCYWKDPADLSDDGDLILFHPREREWMRLNETAWKIWEIKARGEQTETAAKALGQDDHDKDVLAEIDSFTLDLRKMGLLQNERN